MQVLKGNKPGSTFCTVAKPCQEVTLRLSRFPKSIPSSTQERPTTTHPPNITFAMTSVAAGLFKSLPKPKYTGEDEELPAHAQPRGPRIVGAGALNDTQVVLKVSPTHIEDTNYSLTRVHYSVLGLLHTASAQDGDLARQRILEMEGLSPRYRSRNIPSTWVARAHLRPQMPWLYK